MKNISKSFIISLFFSVTIFCQVPQNPEIPEITADEIRQHLNYLASDELEGRFSGSKGEKLAADYIKNEFIKSGLQPIFNGSYIQEFSFIAGIKLGENNSAVLNSDKTNKTLTAGENYYPLPFSDNLNVNSDIVFAGYGITAEDLNYDDYENIDVKDKIVIVLRHHPELSNPHSKFDQYAALRKKANTAKDNGAKALILVNGYFPDEEEDEFIKLKYDGAPAIENFAAIQIKRTIIEELFKNSNKNLKSLQHEIDSTLKPNSFNLKNAGLKLSTDLKLIEKTAANVAGILKANNNPSGEFVVIGAHYDHLGYGETGSLYRGKEKLIHNGADDNASGTTGLLELAEKFETIKNELSRDLVFIAFSGEELGLLGSNHFVNNSPLPIDKNITMINMDMIGRMNEENSLTIYGAGTSPIWKDLLNDINNKYDFKISFNDEGFGPSDHSSFYGKKIPVLFFFTGVHTDYHRPSDDTENINFDKQALLLNFIYETALKIINNNDTPVYVSVPRKDTGGAMRFKVYVGTIPDYSSQSDGFKITGVSEGSPAQKGGLQGGDIIIEFGGKPVKNIYDYMYAMNEFAPGDLIEVIVLRNGEKKTFELELAAK